MNLPKKSPNSATKPISCKEDLVKLHCVHHLFADATGEDPYLVQHIKEAIDESLREEPALEENLETFAEAAIRLLREQPFVRASYGFFHLNLTDRGFDPLFVREELLQGLKRIAGYETTLIVVTGLRSSICPKGKYFTRRQQEVYAHARDYVDRLAQRYSTANTHLSILYL